MNKRSRSSTRVRRNPEAIAFARDQRRSANEFAQKVWQLLSGRRCRGQKFRREYPIPPYTADFCCVSLMLNIEVDGKHHQTEKGQQRDRRRDEFLADNGYEVMRIPGYKVTQDPLAVQRRIEQAIDERIDRFRPLTPDPSPQTSLGRGEPE
ncbi:MAG: endonuclease domain-containing protein [Planctomycetota bacterium]